VTFIVAGYNDHDGHFRLSTGAVGDFFLRFDDLEVARVEAEAIYKKLPELRVEWCFPLPSGSKDYVVVAKSGASGPAEVWIPCPPIHAYPVDCHARQVLRSPTWDYSIATGSPSAWLPLHLSEVV
jgi:hypothetical protein